MRELWGNWLGRWVVETRMVQRFYIYSVLISLYLGLFTLDVALPFTGISLRISLLEPVSCLLALSLFFQPGLARRTVWVFGLASIAALLLLAVVLIQAQLIETYDLRSALRAVLRQIGVCFIFASYSHLFCYFKKLVEAPGDSRTQRFPEDNLSISAFTGIVPILLIVGVLFAFQSRLYMPPPAVYSLQFTVLLIVILLVQIFFTGEEQRKRLWLLLSAQFIIVAIFAFWAASTTAMLVSLCAAILIFVLYGPNKMKIGVAVGRNKNRAKVVFLQIVVLVMFISTTVYFFAGTGQFDEFTNMIAGLAVRAGLWSFAFADIAASPWLGVGLGQEAQKIILEPEAVRAAPDWVLTLLSVDPATRPDAVLSSVHSTPINLALGYGIPIAMLICFGLASLCYLAIKGQPFIFGFFILFYASPVLLLSDGLTVRGLIVLLAFAVTTKLPAGPARLG